MFQTHLDSQYRFFVCNEYLFFKIPANKEDWLSLHISRMQIVYEPFLCFSNWTDSIASHHNNILKLTPLSYLQNFITCNLQHNSDKPIVVIRL